MMSILDAGSAIGVVLSCLVHVYDVFEQFLEATHMTFVWQSFVVIALVVAFILKPILGHEINAGASDYVKKQRKESKKNK